MPDGLEEHDGKVSIGVRNVNNMQFGDDIHALAEEEQELEAVVESPDNSEEDQGKRAEAEYRNKLQVP